MGNTCLSQQNIVVIKTLQQKFTIQVENLKISIQQLKQRISTTKNIPQHTISLSFNSTQTKNDQTLQSLGFDPTHHNFNMNLKDMSQPLSINIRSINFTHKMTLKCNSKVLQVKEGINQKYNMPTYKQRLIFKGKVLKDNQPLLNYGIQEDSTVHLGTILVP